MIKNCHYIDMQLERIRNAGIGAGAELSSEGSSGLEEQLQIIESAVSRIRDEMRRRSDVTRSSSRGHLRLPYTCGGGCHSRA